MFGQLDLLADLIGEAFFSRVGQPRSTTARRGDVLNVVRGCKNDRLFHEGEEREDSVCGCHTYKSLNSPVRKVLGF